MKLRIEDISASPKELRFEESGAEVNRLLQQGPVQEFWVEGPMEVRLSHYRSSMELFFSGHVEARLRALCARCAEQFEVTSGRDFRFVLTPKAANLEPEHAIGIEDLELSTYEGEEIDLTPLVREQLLLALPTRALCEENCRGLCPHCGTNLNTGACGCARPAPDPRLEIFRTLKLPRA